MPKYKNKSAAHVKQHQIDTLTEQYATFLDDMDAQHEERIKQMRADHKKHKDELIAAHEKQKQDLMADAVFDIKQNKSLQPMELAPGIIVLPGDYYVEDGLQGPFGIAAAAMATEFEQVT